MAFYTPVATPSKMLDLPNDILIMLPEYIHNIEDFTNLASTCCRLRQCMQSASRQSILRMAAAQSAVFFRPSPFFLVAATARELGNWARRADENEALLAARLEDGIEGLFELCLERCGLSMRKIWKLHALRYEIINPVTDVIDKCIGEQWAATPNFDNVFDDAYTILSDPPEAFFHLAIYGELFAPDFEPILTGDTATRRLQVATRLEYVKYCVPDCRTIGCDNRPEAQDRGMDLCRLVKRTGPYSKKKGACHLHHNLALLWLMKSPQWRPYWRDMRELAGVSEFDDNFDPGWFTEPGAESNRRQQLLENVMVCQGLEGLGMVLPEVEVHWVKKVRRWQAKIARMSCKPATIMVRRQATAEYPFLLGDLRILQSGYLLVD